MTEQKHHPVYLVSTRSHQRWAYCRCGQWRTDPNVTGNQTWAQQEFAKHLQAAK